jgi:hypothetical protein
MDFASVVRTEFPAQDAVKLENVLWMKSAGSAAYAGAACWISPLDLPVGERSAFTTIFGRPEVNLRVTGSANMNVGASIQ